MEHGNLNQQLRTMWKPGQLIAVGITMLVVLPSWSRTMHAENWARFRGPNGSGIAGEVSFPATWTEQDYLWKQTLPGKGHSSPVGWQSRLFITSGNAETGAVILQCLDADSGEQQWQRELIGQSYAMHTFNSYASSTPTVDDQRVYLSWASGGKMQCAALTHPGKNVWRTELGDFVGAHGFAASPVVVDGVVCLHVDLGERGFLAGLDASSGEVRWRAERPAGKVTYSTPCVVSTVGSRAAVISQSMTGGMQAVDVQSGAIVWQLDDLFPARCVSSPFVAGNMVFGVCGGGGSGKLLAGIEFGTPDQLPREKLMLTKQVPYVSTPLVKDQGLYLWHDQGKISYVDLNSEAPQKVAWTERIGGKFFGSPILAGDKIYCLSMDGLAVVIAADSEFALLGENDLGEPTSATPAVHQGKMYLRTESSLACLPAE